MNSPTDVSIITTYRCQMRCKMCGIWEHPTDPEKEIKARELEILPKLKFANVTGGEPFLRDDLEDIVEVLYTKAPRIVISTSGYWTEKAVKMAERFPNIGIRVSIEGMERTNNFLRGKEDGYERGLRTLKLLHEMKIKDIGFGQTLSNHNSKDLIPLYELGRTMNLEFATAAFHNGYYFHKYDNQISEKEELCRNIGKLINCLLKEKHPKAWFRAYFNHGLINYIKGNKRLLPCKAGTMNFFIDPYGEVYPCNALEERYWKKSMGNIRSGMSFAEIWNSPEACEVRRCVENCPKNCWMMGTVAPVMKTNLHKVVPWVVWQKAKRRTKVSVKISVSNREKKNKLFTRLFNPTANDKILDVGYSNEPVPNNYENYLEKKYPYLNNITALGIQDYDSIQVYNNDLARGGNEFKTVKYDGRTFPFSDESFDIGYCNAVIEHVGNREAQILFVKEICRVCKKVFLTTPNRFFPIETHTKYPFIHWLPDKLFLKILSKTKEKYWATNLYLLSECSLKKILNAAGLKGKYCMYKQRFFGFTMTFSVEILRKDGDLGGRK